MTRKEHVVTILVLGSLSTISPFAIDMYLPGFPAIAADLGAPISQVQLSLTGYLIGIAAGQLLYGPLLDRFGRRPPLYAGLIIYILASIGCAYANSIESLIGMRFLQAIGGCGSMVAAQTLVRDLFPANRTAQAFSSITLVIAVSPMIAPTVGSYVTVAFGWHAVFVILAIVAGLILASVHFALPEGKMADPTLSLKPKAVVKGFIEVIKEPQFVIYTLAGGIAMSAPFAFIAGSPDVFMNIYHVKEREYGWIFATVATAIIGSSQLNYLLLKKFTNQQLVKYILIYQTTVGVVLMTGTVLGWYGKYSLVAMMFLLMCGQGIVGPNSTALSLAPFTRNTGSAASLLGSFRMAVGGMITAAVGLFHNGTAIPMIAGMIFCVTTGLIILAGGKVTVRYRARKKAVEEESALLM